MVLPTVLKRRHSLKDVNIVPVIKRIRSGKPDKLKEFARVQKDVKTKNLDLDEINSDVQAITGEEVGEVLIMAGRQENIEEARWALHCIVLYTNEFGQPEGQDLQDQQQVIQTATARTGDSAISGLIL